MDVREINNIVNTKLKTSIKIDNRDVVCTICINHLQNMLNYCEDKPSDRNYIANMIDGIWKQIFSQTPMKLERLPYNLQPCCKYQTALKDPEFETLYVTLTGKGEIYTESNYKHFPNAFVDIKDKLITFDEPNVDDFYKDESGNNLIFEEK